MKKYYISFEEHKVLTQEQYKEKITQLTQETINSQDDFYEYLETEKNITLNVFNALTKKEQNTIKKVWEKEAKKNTKDYLEECCCYFQYIPKSNKFYVDWKWEEVMSEKEFLKDIKPLLKGRTIEEAKEIVLTKYDTIEIVVE